MRFPQLDREALLPTVIIARRVRLSGPVAAQLDPHNTGRSQPLRLLCDSRWKVIADVEVRQGQTGFQQQLLSRVRVSHAIAEPAREHPNRDICHAAREKADRIELGVRVERPNANQSERERGRADTRHQAELERDERDRNDIKQRDPLPDLRSCMAKREHDDEKRGGGHQHHVPPLDPATNR